MNYVFHLLIYLEIFVLVASGLNVIVGYCGLLSLSQGAFFALGGYGFALASLRLGFGFPTALAFACLVATISSLCLSIPARRARGDSFVLASLALQSLLFSIAGNWYSTDSEIGTIRNMTNGPFGIADIPSPVVLSYTFDDASEYAVLGCRRVHLRSFVALADSVVAVGPTPQGASR